MRAIVLAAALLALAAPAALARDIAIDEFRARVDVAADGVVHVEERIAVRFEGTWNGILRVIPYGYTYRYGVRGDIRLTVDAVEDGAGTALEHWTSRDSGRLVLKIRVPGASDAVRTVRVKYHAENVVRRWDEADASFGVHDELYWNVTGNDWEMPIAKAFAEIHLPASIPAEGIRAEGWTGRYGATEKAFRLERGEGNVLRYETTAPLGTYEGLTVAVGFPPGHVRIPSLGQRIWWDAQANWQVLIPLALLGFWFFRWWRKGRDPLGHRTVIPEFEAPEGLTAAEAGVLTDDRVDPRDVTAAVVGLAVQGAIVIEEIPAEKSGEKSEKKGGFRLRRRAAREGQGAEAADLSPFETALLDGLFGSGAAAKTVVEVEDLTYKFQKNLSAVKDRLLDGVVEKGWFTTRPDRVRGAWVGGTWMLAIGLAVAGAFLQFPVTYFVALLVAMPFLVILAARMPKRTVAGMDLRARVQGIEEYLKVAEKERMAALPLGQVERLLPFAIALGMEDRWSTAFAALFTEAPDWYRSSAPWTPGGFGTRLGYLHGSLTSSLWSVPRSTSSGHQGFGGRSWGGGWSGGGGFGGGGSSGGGFGGGGGRGW